VSSIVFAGKSNTETLIKRCTFIKNYAVTGGVFYAESWSKIRCEHCVFDHNFAFKGGVAYAQGDGIIEIISSEFMQNFALAGPTIMLFDNNGVSSFIDDSLFEANNGFSFEDLKTEIYEYCTLLCYFKESFRI